MGQNSNYKRQLYKKIIYTFISIGITAGIMWYLFKGMSVRDLRNKAGDMDPNALLCFMVLSFSQLFFRTWRYQILLRNAGERVGNIAMALTTQIRNFFSDLLPARLGTLSFVWVATQRLNVPLETATSTFALAFLFDSIVMFPMILFALILAGGFAGLHTNIIIAISAVMLIILALILWALPRFLSFAGRILGSVNRPAFKHFAKHFLDAGEQVKNTRSAGLYTKILVLSFLVRIMKYGAMYFLFYAWMKQYGNEWADLPVASAFLAIAAAEFAASTPFSGIAGFGAYEGTFALVLILLGFASQTAREASFAGHLLSQVWGYSLGAASLLIILLPFFGKKNAPKESVKIKNEHWVTFMVKILISFFAVAAIIATIIESGKEKKSKINVEKPTSAEQAAIKQISKELDGRIVFDSNRSGTFGIYTMNPDGTGVKALIDTGRHEMYPDASPDGQWVVFASAASLGKRAQSDIWIIGIDGTNARKLVDNGTFPSWSADGKKVYFERERKKLMAVDINGSEPEEVLPKKAPETGKYELVKPHVSHDGKYAAFITDREGRWNVWLANLQTGEVRHVGRGCEPAWFPDDKALVWIGPGSPGTSIRKYELDSGKTSVVQDTPPPRATEYFPSISRDGKYLFYSAAPHAREAGHSTSNYQIFVKPLDGRAAVRLTFDGYTNRWPSFVK